MKNINIILFLLFFLTISCNIEGNYYYKGLKFLEDNAHFKKENNLILFDYGVNCNRTKNTPDWDNIHYFRITFYCIENLNLNEARKKIINCIEKYLQLINSDQKLKPFLYKHPFPQNDLFFSIVFCKENGKNVDKKFISKCFVDNDKIYYFNTPEYESYHLLHKETYEEALEKLNNS